MAFVFKKLSEEIFFFIIIKSPLSLSLSPPLLTCVCDTGVGPKTL